MDTESIRQSYRPDSIRLLLVGESPPANGGFFYDRSLMTSYTASAFMAAYGIERTDTATFLQLFKDKGYYLDDISVTPVDALPNRERELVLEGCVEDFAKRLKEYNPDVVAVVLKKIAGHVEAAMRLAGLTCPYYVLPFPGHGHQRKYIDQLAVIIKEHLV